MASAAREQWSSRAGFVLAAVGSAVGLGNMWRFSYLTAENGGAAFVILYLGITLALGLPVLLAELVIGRGAQKSPIRALAHFGGEVREAPHVAQPDGGADGGQHEARAVGPTLPGCTGHGRLPLCLQAAMTRSVSAARGEPRNRAGA